MRVTSRTHIRVASHTGVHTPAIPNTEYRTRTRAVARDPAGWHVTERGTRGPDGREEGGGGRGGGGGGGAAAREAAQRPQRPHCRGRRPGHMTPPPRSRGALQHVALVAQRSLAWCRSHQRACALPCHVGCVACSATWRDVADHVTVRERGGRRG
eukprot:3511224-Rhodomonas_salina.3